MERLVLEEQQVAIGLCDRGTVDGVAYWPPGEESYWHAVGSMQEREVGRYEAVIHLETPPLEGGYHKSALRIESAREARRIGDRIAEAWTRHSKFHTVASTADFLTKVTAVLELVRAELPACCATHLVPGETTADD